MRVLDRPPPPTVCSVCEKELTQSPWNTKVDVFYCDNWHCHLCRVPVGLVEIAFTSMETVVERLKKFNDMKTTYKTKHPLLVIYMP